LRIAPVREGDVGAARRLYDSLPEVRRSESVAYTLDVPA
jgi:hypothetical protein